MIPDDNICGNIKCVVERTHSAWDSLQTELRRMTTWEPIPPLDRRTCPEMRRAKPASKPSEKKTQHSFVNRIVRNSVPGWCHWALEHHTVTSTEDGSAEWCICVEPAELAAAPCSTGAPPSVCTTNTVNNLWCCVSHWAVPNQSLQDTMEMRKQLFRRLILLLMHL